jgi:hypothetical protein
VPATLVVHWAPHGGGGRPPAYGRAPLARAVDVGLVRRRRRCRRDAGVLRHARSPRSTAPVIVFVYLAPASSGGTVPLQALPGFYRFVANFEPLRQIVGAVRAILYFNGAGDAGLDRGLLLTSIGAPVLGRCRRRRDHLVRQEGTSSHRARAPRAPRSVGAHLPGPRSRCRSGRLSARGRTWGAPGVEAH